MRSRLILGLIAAAALSLGAACNKGKEVVTGLKKLQDKACACEEQECADKVLDEFVTFATDNKEARGTDDHIEEAGKITEKTFNCLLEAGVSQDKVMKAAEELQKLQ